MATQKHAPAPSLFDNLPAPRRAMSNPIFINVDGVLIYHVRKNDWEPESSLMKNWFSREPNNRAPVDVRSLAGYVEPEYEPQGDPMASSERWNQQLAAEAERVIRLALANGTFIGRSDG
jgi:hypothetical protein